MNVISLGIAFVTLLHMGACSCSIDEIYHTFSLFANGFLKNHPQSMMLFHGKSLDIPLSLMYHFKD
jgi:hypothetical protein